MSTASTPGGLDSILKGQVREFWDRQSCGEIYAVGHDARERFEAHGRARYELEPYIIDFARFHEGTGKDVLEIGVGMGADHLEWARSRPRTLTGIDLTPRAVEFTGQRLELFGFHSHLRIDDAENLSFSDDSFDLVYSWGVLHHSPDTPRAIEEVRRVLRPGGAARIMIYHYYSMVGFMLWGRYGLLRGRPMRSLADIYASHMESPGTKAYTVSQAREMFRNYSACEVRVMLSFGDLLEGSVGQRHRGLLLSTARTLWPRRFIKAFLKNQGSMLLIDAVK